MPGRAVSEEDMEPSDNVGAADWIVTQLADRSYQVRMLLPPVFAAYARILHPVVTGTGAGRRLTRWHEIAAAAGLTPLDRCVQFPALTAGPGVQAADDPPHGELPGEDRDVLLRVLAAGTSTAGQCWFCVWDGYGLPGGQASGRETGQVFMHVATPPGRPRGRHRVQRPAVCGFLDRRYFLYSGPLTASAALGLPPSLYWPEDHAWAVAADHDLDSTYVGGDAGLVGTLLAHPQLEVLPAGLDDPVTSDPGRNG